MGEELMRKTGRTSSALSLTVLLVATGCAGAAFSVPAPEELPALEARVARDSLDSFALVRLGAGYRSIGRLADAQQLLEAASALDPESDAATLFLGLTYEDLGQDGDAQRVYESYLAQDDSDRLRREIEGRLPLLRRRVLLAATAEAIEREEQLEVPSPGTVAVFPFLYSGQAAEYAPLGRAITAMLVTDLAQTDRLTVLERLHIQVLLDEIALGESDLVDPATASRGGRLAGAAHVVQGVLDGDLERIVLDAVVVAAVEEPGTGEIELSDEDAVANLIDVEKRTAFAIYESLGVVLTVAERERVSERWTENIVALLEFGFGLEAEARGDFAEAAARFRNAAELDPGFGEAASAAESNELAVEAESTSTTELGEQVALELAELSGFTEFTDLTEALGGVQDLVPTSERRDVISEVLGTEGFGGAILEVIIRLGGDAR